MQYKYLIEKIKNNTLDNINRSKYGCSNINYEVDGKYFVRISTGKKKNEHEILDKCQQLELCPKLYYYDDETGDMVSEYIDGTILKCDERNNNDILKRIASSLKVLHKEKVDFIFNPVEEIYSMYKRINKQKKFEFYNNCVATMKRILEKYRAPSDLSLCHNDITAGNILITEEKIFLIDFEFSAMNDIYYDIAGFCCMLSDEKKEFFINNYFEDKECDKEKLNDYIKINFIWNASWNLIKYLENGNIKHLEYSKEYIDLIDIKQKK